MLFLKPCHAFHTFRLPFSLSSLPPIIPFPFTLPPARSDSQLPLRWWWQGAPPPIRDRERDRDSDRDRDRDRDRGMGRDRE